MTTGRICRKPACALSAAGFSRSLRARALAVAATANMPRHGHFPHTYSGRIYSGQREEIRAIGDLRVGLVRSRPASATISNFRPGRPRANPRCVSRPSCCCHRHSYSPHRNYFRHHNCCFPHRNCYSHRHNCCPRHNYCLLSNYCPRCNHCPHYNRPYCNRLRRNRFRWICGRHHSYHRPAIDGGAPRAIFRGGRPRPRSRRVCRPRRR